MKHPLPLRFCQFLLLLLALFGFGAAGHAATFTVDRTDDADVSTCSTAANDCTLRGAIIKANAAAGTDTITFSALFSSAQTITLDTELPHLSGGVTIAGPGADKLTVQPIYQEFTLFTVDTGVSATLKAFTLSNALDGIVNNGTITVAKCIVSGNSSSSITNKGTMTATDCIVGDTYGFGIVNNFGTLTAARCTIRNSDSGIFNGFDSNDTSATVNMTACTVSGNLNYGSLDVSKSTVNGNINFGITNVRPDGKAVILNCTISDNPTGIFNRGTIAVTHCTVSGNSTGINILDGAATLKNSLVAGNSDNISGTIINGGYNISSGTAAAAGLEVDGSGNPVLADNGGPTKTIKLLPGSPAIDKGKNFGVTTDQRDSRRPSDNPTIPRAADGDNSDIGAFELTFVPSIAVNNPRSLPEGSALSPGSVTFEITLNAPSTQSVTVNYKTLDGINNPATAGADYVAKSGKLTFAPGETLKRVTINFIGDDKAESKKTFFLDLYSPTNATIADSRGVGTIANDDATPNVFEDEPSQ